MHPLIQEISATHTPESLVWSVITARPHGQRPILLRSGLFDSPQARYSFVAARPFLTFHSFGSRCEISTCGVWPSLALPKQEANWVQYGDPWRLLDSLMSRYELLDEVDLPFPLGGCFGYWGYGLKNFVEPKLPRGIADDLELPDSCVGFYDSLVVFDHWLGKTWIVATGLAADGSRTERRAHAQAEFWAGLLSSNLDLNATASFHEPPASASASSSSSSFSSFVLDQGHSVHGPSARQPVEGAFHESSNRKSAAADSPSTRGEGRGEGSSVFRTKARESAPDIHRRSSLTRSEFISRVQTAQRYIRAGDIYQVNISQRFNSPYSGSGWELFEALSAVSPAPFAAYLDCDEFQIVSSSPEQFLRLSGSHIRTRPIKGTRPRSADPTRDAQLSYELQTSAKEMAELVMITDLLRNDLGKVCEFGSVQVPELARLEKYPQVQHLVSTVEGRLRRDVTHFAAFSSCFPGGSITGAPKFRAMQIIDELEPVARGPYTGALGYLGFNRESQLSIIIRTAVLKDGRASYGSGAGIVADSAPEAEYEETLAKARGFFAALETDSRKEARQARGQIRRAHYKDV